MSVYFPQQRWLISHLRPMNRGRKYLDQFIDFGIQWLLYINGTDISPAWTPTLSYDSSLFVSFPSDLRREWRVLRDKFQKCIKQSQLKCL